MNKKTKELFPKIGSKLEKELFNLAFGKLKDYDEQASRAGVLHDSVGLSNKQVFDIDIRSYEDSGEAQNITAVPIDADDYRCNFNERLLWVKLQGKWVSKERKRRKKT